MAFQIPQMFRNGRLRDGEIARGGRDGPAFDGAHEGAEGNYQVHKRLAVMGSHYPITYGREEGYEALITREISAAGRRQWKQNGNQ